MMANKPTDWKMFSSSETTKHMASFLQHNMDHFNATQKSKSPNYPAQLLLTHVDGLP